jgi:hypothetical protein
MRLLCSILLFSIATFCVYSFGAAEGLLLDRFNPKWKDGYFKNALSMDSFFEN